MAERKTFQVVFCTGSDAGFPISELNQHSPHTKGWQSPRFCEYPQEIGVELLDGTAHLTQLQVLAHQSKIPCKIELFVGVGDPGAYDKPETQFKRLGFMSLDSNERSQYQARELKSVYIDATGRFLKFKVHKCFVNKYNLFNQVGIVAINVLGAPANMGGGVGAGRLRQQEGGREDLLPVKYTAPNRPSPMEDLAFDMNFDRATAQKIRQIHDAKTHAVEVEAYEQAKALKLAEDQLKALGVQLAKLEMQKRQAVQAEEYDQATALKSEIARLRTGVDKQLARIPMFAGGCHEPQQQRGDVNLPPVNAGTPPSPMQTIRGKGENHPSAPGHVSHGLKRQSFRQRQRQRQPRRHLPPHQGPPGQEQTQQQQPPQSLLPQRGVIDADEIPIRPAKSNPYGEGTF